MADKLTREELENKVAELENALGEINPSANYDQYRQVTLDSGLVIDPDLSKVTIREFRTMIDPATDEETGDKILAKIVGMMAVELSNLSYPEYRKVARAVIVLSQEPPSLDSGKA